MSQFSTTQFADLDAAIQAAYEACRRRREREGTVSYDGEDPRERAIDASWSASGVPGRYRGVEPYGQPVGWTYIWGPVGSGKTTGACRMLRRHLEDSCTELAPGLWSRPGVRFTTAQGYLAGRRAAWKAPEMDRSIVERGCDCLVVDDLGQEQPTQWAVAQLFDLIDHRYGENLRTIVTSQFPLSAMEARLSENGGAEQARALVSRLVGCCRVIALGHGDRRAT